LIRHWSLLLLLLVAGCPPAPPAAPQNAPALYVAPLPVQQAQAYPETVTRHFVSLADFESEPATQVGYFSFAGAARPLDPADKTPPSRKLVVNITRTGAGAMEVVLPPGMTLVFDVPQIHDFSGYSLLSLALYSESVRDDLRVTVASDAASWTSLPTLLQPGWNTVLIDIRRLAELRDFDIHGVRRLKLQFVDAAGAVRFNLDDIMLLENRRQIAPTPLALRLEKNALDYVLTLQNRRSPVEIKQREDGLWRLGADQSVVQLASPGQALPESIEQLAPMGQRRVGKVEVLENNPLRLRLAVTWYFPTRPGEWASLAVRQIRWEYTFYGDGRWVTHLELNNAGGGPIQALRIRCPQAVALSGDGVRQEIALKDLSDAARRWDYLTAAPGEHGQALEQNFLHPPRIVATLAAPDAYAPGDADRDGFDESQGCYFLRAKAGHCRFTIVPPEGGLHQPAFRVEGKWLQMPDVNCEGLAIRDAVRLDDGSILFVLRENITRPTRVEVVGPVSYLDARP
jgi:hypothetical protein